METVFNIVREIVVQPFLYLFSIPFGPFGFSFGAILLVFVVADVSIIVFHHLRDRKEN